MEYKAQYQEYLLQATAALDAASARFLPEESEVCRAARYSLLGGGKRIRAILTLSVCDMLGGEMQTAAQFAAAVEMLHCYSLIHDDLPCMDNDDLRRGRPSCHKAFSDGDGSAKREPGCLLGQNVGSHESRHPKTFAGSRRANAIIPSPSSSLTIGQHHRQRRRSSFGKTTRLGHGGAHFVKPVNFP